MGVKYDFVSKNEISDSNYLVLMANKIEKYQDPKFPFSHRIHPMHNSQSLIRIAFKLCCTCSTKLTEKYHVII